MTTTIRIVLATLVLPSIYLTQCGSSRGDDLLRRVSLGTQLQPITAESQQRLGLKSLRGVEVVNVFPNSTAEDAGLKPGDAILSLSGKSIAGLQPLVDHLNTLRAGAELRIGIQRDGQPSELKTIAKELARETSSEFDIEYGSVAAPVGKLRTVLTLPRTPGKHRAVVLLGGLGNAFAEHPVADPTGAKAIAYALTNKGIAVLRVDKPGCGDSEGGPSRDVDFQSIVDGYIAAVKKIKNDPRIDSRSVFLFGMSIGGVQAPLIAASEPVRGIGVFGTMSMDWQDYMVGTTKRQLKLNGASDEQITDAVQVQMAGWRAIIQDGLTPDELISKNDGLSDWSEQTWQDGKYFSGISYKFFQQLGKAKVEAAWRKFEGPAIALWGEMDFVTSKEDHAKIAELVNEKSTNKGSFLEMPKVDHNLQNAASMEEAMKPSTPRTFAISVVDTYADWLKKVSLD